MAVRIHQLLAVIGGLNAEVTGVMTRLQHVATQEDLFKGLEKKSRPASDQADPKAPKRRVTPDKVTKVRVTADQVLADARKLMTRKWDTALTLDAAQAAARADVVVGEVTVLHDVPVRHLVYLEGELTTLTALVAALPELDGVQEWDNATTEPGQWRSAPREGDLKEKAYFNWHRENGTDKIQEQVDVMTRDEVVELNTTVNFSGALPAKRKAQLLERLSELRTAVKMAREEANSATVTQLHEGEDVFSYLLAP